MTDEELFRVLSQLQHDVGLLRELMFYTLAMLFVAGIAAVLAPILSRRGIIVNGREETHAGEGT